MYASLFFGKYGVKAAKILTVILRKEYSKFPRLHLKHSTTLTRIGGDLLPGDVSPQNQWRGGKTLNQIATMYLNHGKQCGFFE